ncbi:MAG: IPT/TIG domain-containing protein [Candidatus Margulisiibacteriota bacterium]
MKNILKIGGLVFGLALVLMAVAGSANASVVIPSKSVINPVTQTVYVPNNGASPSEVRIYYRSGNGLNSTWLETRKISITTSTTAKVYGLAISADGKRLFVSINDSYQSQLRIYDLDINNYGIPTYNYKLAQWTPASNSSPAGVTVVDNRAYVADMGSARVHIFDYDGSNWKKTGEITEGLTGLGAIYDVATGPKVDNKFGYSYPIFVSRKTIADGVTKQLFMYSYNYAINFQTKVVTTSINFLSSANVETPTYMKVANGKLYVAVKDSTADVKIFDYSGGTLVEDTTPINNGTNFYYGWAGLDLAPDGSALYYTQAQNSNENPTKLIKIVLPGTNPIIKGSHAAPYDGLVISTDNMYAISTYSWSGTIQADVINNDPIQPVITSVSPTQSVYGVNVEATVTGKNFINGSTSIFFGSMQMPVNVVSSTLAKITVDNGFYSQFVSQSQVKHVFELWSRNEGGLALFKPSGVFFTVNPSTANWPTVTSIDPNNGVQGQTVNIVNLIGTNFVKGTTPADSTTVKLYRAGTNTTINALVTVVDDKHIIGAIPIKLADPIGSYDVVATNPDSNVGTLPAGFTVFAPGTAPTVTKIDPNLGLIESSISGKITGTNFQAGATAYLSKAGQAPIPVNLSNITPTSMDYSIANLGDMIGLWTVNVKNPNNQIGSLYNGFNIVVNADKVPTITAVYPSKAPNTVDTNIIIEGTNLDTATAADIQINPTKPLTNLKVISATKLSATFPALTYTLPAGTYHITVSNKFGTSAQTKADVFEVTKGLEDPAQPSQIQNFTAADNEDKQSTLHWFNPADNDMAAIEVRRYASAYPASYDSSGTPVYGANIIPKPSEEITFPDAPLTNNTTYYYVAFIKDTSGNWSTVQIGKNADTATPGTGGSADVPRNLMAVKSGNDAILTWDAPQAGEPGGGYRVYRGTSPTTITNLVGEVLAGTHTLPDTGAVMTTDSYYYVAKAFTGPTESGPSNMASIVKINLVKNQTTGSKYWISIPYLNSYATLASIIDDMNGIGDITTGAGLTTAPTNCDYIARLNPTTQQFEAVWWDGQVWNSATDDGNTPALETPANIIGEGFEISVLKNFTMAFAGGNDPNFTFTLTKNATIGNKHWISIPYTTTYTTIASIIGNINGIGDITTGAGLTTAPTNCDYIARLNPTTQQFEAVWWDGQVWNSATDDGNTPALETPAVVIGEGYEMSILKDISWKPLSL